MSLHTDLMAAAEKAAKVEEKLERVTFCAYVLCRTLGLAHGEGGPAFVGSPTAAGFVNTDTAVRQLMEALSS